MFSASALSMAQGLKWDWALHLLAEDWGEFWYPSASKGMSEYMSGRALVSSRFFSSFFSSGGVVLYIYIYMYIYIYICINILIPAWHSISNNG